MKDVKVSVVVPIYNVEPYLAECLDSLERQSLKDIEVIMVNDGSTDDSGRIAVEYASRNDNFYLIERKNGGLSAARNTGMQEASGKYIYFLDSDDYLVDTALETLYKKAEADDLDVLTFSGYVFEDGSKDLQWKREGGYKYNGEYANVCKGTDLLQGLLDNKDEGLTSCCMIFTRSDIIKKYNLSFLEGIVNEDNLFFLQLISVCERTEVLNEPLYCRRRRDNSITGTIDYRLKLNSMITAAREAEEFYKNNKEFHTNAVERYIGRFLIIMMSCWKKMGRELVHDEEVGRIYTEMRLIAKKHAYFHDWRIKLFLSNAILVRMYAFLYSMR